MAEKKSAELKIRVIPSELESWRAAASERDMPLSAFVRAACNESSQRVATVAGPLKFLESQVPAAAVAYTVSASSSTSSPFQATFMPETGRRCPHGRQSGQWCPVCDR